MVRLGARTESVLLRTLLGLPPTTVRWLAGRQVLLDGQVLSPETQLLLRIQRAAREPDVATLGIDEGRTTLRRHCRLAGGEQPIGSTRELEVSGADGPLPARLYEPTGAADQSALLVFFHGGGMLYGDLDTHDCSCRVLAERAGVRVLAVDYRLAPEHPFPAGVDDACAAYAWVVEHAAEVGADPDRIAVGGDSAGGYLSAVVATDAARRGLPCAFQLLLYPVTDFAEKSESRELFSEGFYLTQTFIDRAEAEYLGPDTDRRDPRVSVLYADVPAGLAPALVVTAGFDPLRDEGEAYARKLAEAGVDVELRRFSGEIHGFFSVVGIGRTSRGRVDEIADELAKALPQRA